MRAAGDRGEPAPHLRFIGSSADVDGRSELGTRNREGFLTHYARARDIQCELHADQLVEIADGVDEGKAAVDKARLRIQTRQWNLAHLLPKKYGARIALGNADEQPLKIATEERNALIEAICRPFSPERTRKPSQTTAAKRTGTTSEEAEKKGRRMQCRQWRGYVFQATAVWHGSPPPDNAIPLA